EVRVLYELAHHPGQTARALATGLGLDEGYLSRLLKRFGQRGWLERRPDPADSRAATLALTAQGAAAFRPLEERSRAEVAAMIADLPPGGQEALAEAAEAVQAAVEGG